MDYHNDSFQKTTNGYYDVYAERPNFQVNRTSVLAQCWRFTAGLGEVPDIRRAVRKRLLSPPL